MEEDPAPSEKMMVRAAQMARVKRKTAKPMRASG